MVSKLRLSNRNASTSIDLIVSILIIALLISILLPARGQTRLAACKLQSSTHLSGIDHRMPAGFAILQSADAWEVMCWNDRLAK